jgi:signal transduction histidine kinase
MRSRQNHVTPAAWGALRSVRRLGGPSRSPLRIRNRSRALCLAIIALAVPGLSLGTARAERLQASISELHALPDSALRKPLPVMVSGILTYLEPGHRMAFLQDHSDAIYVHVPFAKDVSQGDLVEVIGWLDPGYGGRNIRGMDFETSPEIRRIGPGTLPEPVDFPDLNHVADARGAVWTRLHAKINSVIAEGDRTRLTLAENPDLPVYLPGLPHSNLIPGHLAGMHVSLNGVFADSPISESPRIMRRLFLVPGIQHVLFSKSEKLRQFDVSECGLGVLQWIPEKHGPETRVRVSGVVTWKRHGEGFFLQSGTSAAWIQCAEPVLPEIGSAVSCAGRPASFHGSGVLYDALWLEADHPHPPVQAVEPAGPELTSFTHHGRLGRTRAKLVEILKSPGRQLLILNDGPTVIFAHLHDPATTALPDYQPSSLLSIQGILLNQPSPVMDFKTAADAVHFHIRSPDDIRLIRQAPFWTPARLAKLLSTVFVAALLAGAWVIVLRRKVTQQSRIIRGQVSREVVHAERLRMARQWHDTFEQHFAGLTMQLDAASSILPDNSPSRAMLERAARMSNHSREIAREAIWDLRAPDPHEPIPIITRIEEALRLAWPHEFGTRLFVNTNDAHAMLPGTASTALVRIASEAVTNAFKHAHCSRISVEWMREDDSGRLTITDDGSGIAPGSLESASMRGHFGFLGMRERALRIGATLTIQSPPSHAPSGTSIHVRIPNIPASS